ncbi:MAG TPA: hypothetical protein VFX11_18910 [Candidatus Kapabacteria bacterium]|nr:hypothetical protein [Candidatus Kapabacteria bacterium]
MPTFRHFICLCASILVFTGCDTTSKPDSMPRELRQSSVVSTSTPDFAPAPGATLAWKSDLRVKLSPGVHNDPAMVAFIKAEVDRQLQAKGYGFAPAGTTPTFQLEAVLIMGDELNETQLREALGFDPGLVGKDTTYEKGSMLLFLIDPASLQTEWLAVVQVFAAPDLPQDVRQERARFGIGQLMSALPSVNGAQ